MPWTVIGPIALLGLLQDPAQGQKLLQQNRLEEARTVFEQVLARSPGDVDALVGAGFTALRQNRLAPAMAYFQRAIELAPKHADAAYGLALGHWRLGQVDSARRYAREALRLDPKHGEAKALLARMPEGLLPVPPPPARPLDLQVPFRTNPESFQVRDGTGWRTVYLKGVNLGAALPGRFATEFPGKEVYRGWLKDMDELGINVLRVYTIHPPAFYEALREHNLRADRPIYLLHGLWVEPPPGDDFEDPAWFGEWREDMRRMVDLLHGRASFAPRPGFTGGNYRADVSRWWIGTILGREWEPFDVAAYNKLRPGIADWVGRFVEIQQGNATEVFMAKAMDTFIALEHDGYHIQRPVAFSNWPTLDPLTHPTETPYAEEQLLRKKLGLPYDPEPRPDVYDDDSVALDLEKFTARDSFQGGIFASYHIYPNYPEFINLDPTYGRALDHEGTNNFLGYLVDLRRWHRKHAVLVSEYGISNSRIPAHWQPQGMTHGGLDEKAQARMLQRLTRNIHDAGCAGSVTFAWMDEWFKKTWQVEPIERPLERKPLWYNAMSAEENYGLIGHHPGAKGPRILIDGRSGDWASVPAYQKSEALELKLLADEGWLHVGLFWKGPRPDWENERFVLGLDTFDPGLGNHRLPFGVPLRSEAGLEFAVNLSGEGCDVYVDAPYEFAPHRRGRPTRSIAHEDGPWRQMQTETNRMRVGRDLTIFPARRYDVGTLKKGTQDRRDPAFDSLAEWNEGPGFLEVRIPWSLLHVTDPSSLQVLQDPPQPLKGSPLGNLTTEGFRACLVRLRQPEPGTYIAAETLPAPFQGQIPRPPLFTWKGWESPQWHPFRKLAFEAVKQSFAALPDAPVPVPVLRLEPLKPPPSPVVTPVSEPARLLEEARKARDRKDWAASLQAYEALLKQESGHEAALFERAQTLAWAGRHQESIEAWRTFRERRPGRAQEADRNLAEVAGWGGEFAIAVRTLEPYVQKGERWAVVDSARYLSWEGDYRASLSLTATWLSEHPEDLEVLLAHAQVLGWDARLEASQHAYMRVLALNPGHRDARMGLARIAAWRGRFPEARAAFDQLTEADRRTFEARLLEAQILLGEGRRVVAVERLKGLAVPSSPAREDARSLLRASAEVDGPMGELGASRTDSSDGLRLENTYARIRLPLRNGHMGLGWIRHGSELAPNEAAPREVSISLAQSFGFWRVSAELGRASGLEGASTGFHRLAVTRRLAHGMEVSLGQYRGLVLSTPTAVAHRTSLQGFTTGFSWTGFADSVNLQAGAATLSAGNRQRSWGAAYQHRWRISPFTVGLGVASRSLSHSESLPLGFWNPERFRFHGLTGSASYERDRFSLSADTQWGRQSVDQGGWTAAWGYGLDLRWGLGRSPFTLLAGWSASTSGIHAASAFEPRHYREHTFRIGLRATGF